MSEYYLGVDLRGNARFPEAHSVQCVVEWDPRRPLEELRQMAADFYGVPVNQVGPLRETPLSVHRREARSVSTFDLARSVSPLRDEKKEAD